MTHHFPTRAIHLILPNALLLSFYPTMKLTAAAILSLAGLASAETFFKEQFDDVSVVSSIHFLWSTIINQAGAVRHFSIRCWFESRGSTSAIIWLQCRGPAARPRQPFNLGNRIGYYAVASRWFDRQQDTSNKQDADGGRTSPGHWRAYLCGIGRERGATHTSTDGFPARRFPEASQAQELSPKCNPSCV